jgi:type I restriction enzyme S subunit
MNIPKLRFKEFSGEWEEKELKETSIINPKIKELPNKFIYIDLESVEKGLLVKSNEIIKDEAPSRAQRVLSVNDILFQTVRPYQKNNYFFKLNGDYVASTGYAQIRANESSEFLYQKLHTENFVNKVLLRCTGTSYPAINSTDLSKIKIYISGKQEQEKIASFLSSIDKKINQLSKKDELLQNYKKSMMQKIFSQKLRFKKADGNDYPEWEEKKLGKISDVRDGTHDSPKYYDKGYPLITSKNLLSNGKIDFENISLILEEDYNNINKRSKVDIGDILFGMIGTIGNPVLVEKEGFAIKNVALIKEQNHLQNKFLIHYLKSSLIEKQFYEQNTGGTQKFIALGVIRDLIINLPILEEQTKIANFLSSLDTKISQNKKALEETQKFKKALLQKMFV